MLQSPLRRLQTMKIDHPLSEIFCSVLLFHPLQTDIFHAAHLRIMKQYRCTKCGYIYLPAIGDQTQNIKADTPFEDLPDTWVCPRCGAEKKDFVMIA